MCVCGPYIISVCNIIHGPFLKKGQTNLHFDCLQYYCGANVTFRSDLSQIAGRSWDSTPRSNLEENVPRSMPWFPSDPHIKGMGLPLTAVQHQIVSPYVLRENLPSFTLILLKEPLWIWENYVFTYYANPFKCCDSASPFITGGPWVSLTIQSWLMPSYLEEGHCGSVSNSPILYLGLLCQIVCWIDGGFHPLHSQEGSQVGSIRWDYD